MDPRSGPCGTWIALSDLGYVGQGYYRVQRVVDFVSPSGHTYTGLKYKNVGGDPLKVRFLDFFEDGIDPGTGERNFVQDDGSGAGPEEPTLKYCGGLEPGPYQVFVREVYYCDEDLSGSLSSGDTIRQVLSGPVVAQEFELTDGPFIGKLSKKSVQRRRKLRIVGYGFGETPEAGEVRIGRKKHYKNPYLGKGRLLDNIKTWTDTRIEVKLRVPAKWEGETRYVWVEKGGKKSNSMTVTILPHEP